ncbi:MAG: translation initiation factor IF-3 [Actinomycetes bacterium]
MPERDQTRINERIRVPEVRLIGPDGEQVGVLSIDKALAYAQDRDLDLVEVSADSKPPVCRVLDYSKYRYEQAQKQKAARKHQQTIVVREIKFRPKIAQHDYDTKVGHVTRFLKHKDKVKITIMFRGREMAHPERGRQLLERIAEDLVELAVVEQHPLQDGRNMTMMLAPSKALLSDLAKAASASPNGKARTDAAAPEEVVAEAEVTSDGSAPEPVAEPAAVDPAPADSPQED